MIFNKVPSRVVIENVQPSVDGGTFPVKRVVGDTVEVTADIFCDGHDVISAVLLNCCGEDPGWAESAMQAGHNDVWTGAFTVRQIGLHRFTIEAWVDEFKSWRRDFRKNLDAGQDVRVDFLTGIELIEQAASRAPAASPDAQVLQQWAEHLRSRSGEEDFQLILDPNRSEVADRYSSRGHAARSEQEFAVWVDRERARFSSWYEMFPRSCAPDDDQPSFVACEKRLDYVAQMGFDVLYLPPIHPIGRTHRKGKNNSTIAETDDPGSPWAIGADEGGHTAIHPELGTLSDFQHLQREAVKRGMEIAIDLAFQTTPDHPYVKEHPEWFKHRADGSIRYAENPPKKYQDIYPFNFESEDWQSLWQELKNVVFFWLEQGVRIFRVDNPHTKPFAFWEWLISETRQRYPETIFLSEAFTRPKVMYRLAKLGFTQSYTYFTWRNTKAELQQYLAELIEAPVKDFFRPNFWPNTPDILPEFLQFSGRPGFISRLMLAATLSSNYGIYGPAFELLESEPIAPGKEEYLNSEKYQLRHWDLSRPDSLKDVIARVNRIRREQRALRSNESLRFHQTDNDQLIAYSKSTPDLANLVLVVINLDPHHKHSGWLTLPLEQLKIDPSEPYQVHDLLSDARYLWHGARNFVELDPNKLPAHIFAIRRKLRTEHDFDYYM